MKNISSKRRKLENNRFSILQNNVNQCAICGTNYKLTWHEVFEGRNRQNSMKYGLCLRLCLNCHSMITNNNDFLNEWHVKGQKRFIEEYPTLDFINIFYKNYL